MMKDDVLIKVENVSKKFSKDLKTSLKYGVKDVFSNLIGNKKSNNRLRKNEFWSLRDISFELRRGECLGLIGHNGAGKSTLLKILNGLINPDEGKVTIHGRVSALIELGAGFNPILTGRENIYNNGAVLGFTKKEIDDKVDAIIKFAEIEEFIDMPVQNYSSGMKVRLGFSVAAQMEPDVLIIDEVLAVGDVSFRAKCYARMSELMKKCCVIFVTHSMPQVSKICTSALLLKKGKIIKKGSSGDVIESYYEGSTVQEKSNVLYSENCELTSFNISSDIISNYEKDYVIEVELKSAKEIRNVELNLVIMSRELIPVYQGSSKILGQDIHLSKGVNKFQFHIPSLDLNTGIYNFSMTVDDVLTGKKYLWVQNIKSIHVKGKYIGVSPVLINGKWKKDV